MKHSTVTTRDLERDANDESYLTNTNLRNLAWRKVNVSLRRRKDAARRSTILSDIDGYAAAGMIDAPWWMPLTD